MNTDGTCTSTCSETVNGYVATSAPGPFGPTQGWPHRCCDIGPGLGHIAFVRLPPLYARPNAQHECPHGA
jgi:hypothetical protein